ncbi:MAG TPA: glycosyltransferase family 4 protein [Anaeromyxobacteraceae bacterium]|nr:glycosyltransferase family 4 protein [Anaeromyxobacteraceae bacterium]
MLVMSTYGRFHFGQAADALAAQGRAVLLHVADPLARTQRAKIVRAGLHHVAGNALLRRFHPAWLEQPLIASFDAAVARWVTRRRAQIGGVHGGALYCASTLRACRREGIVAVVERSGPHVDAQCELMSSEYDRLGLHRDLRGYWSTDDYRSRMLEEYETADRIVVSSSFAKDTFVARGISPDKVVVVPLGSNFPTRPKRHAEGGKFVVLTVGNDFVCKGIADLLEAWRIANLPRAELRIRAPLPDRWLRLAVKLGNVTVLPPMPHAYLVPHFEAASVFCLLSIVDGFGMVVSEAMACGCPVIVSRNVGARDLVRDGYNGFVVRVRQPADAAERLVELYRDRELLKQMGHGALCSAGVYSWSRYATGMARMWALIAEGRKCVACS